MIQFLRNFNRAVSRRWRILVGAPSEFMLEARVFHSISLGICLLVIAYIPYNLFAGLYVAATSCSVFAGIFGYEYYRSRFLGFPYRSFLFGLLGLVLLSVNYFANAGIYGSTDLIWPVYLVLLLTICPNRLQVTWVIVYLIVFGLVHVAEHLHPEWVQYPFRPGKGQFTDRITAFPIPVISMAIIIGLFRRNYERERAAVAKRDAEKSRLLSILSHDLRAPFIQIKQYLELMNDKTIPPTERVRIEETLKQTNDQTLHLVTNLLYWSRSQLDGAAVHLEEMSLQHTLNSTMAIAGAPAKEKGITLTQNIDPEICVIADADMLQLVVRNLLQNAIKFTPAQGVVDVTAQVSGNRCLISVSDSGSGISPDQLTTILTGAAMPAVGTANEKGVGLGLQLCREFMELQNGGIVAESGVNKGARFTIDLPVIIADS